MMTVKDKTLDAIVAEAASWIAQIDSQSMSQADRSALREWAGRSPRHLMELKRLGEMWCDIDELLLDIEGDAQASPSISNVIGAGARLRPGWVYAIAATLALAVMLPIGMSLFGDEKFETTVIAESTLPGETRLVTLSDGSKLHMNTGTSLEFSSNKDERAVTLMRGEVLVDVKSDPNRPFYIRSDQVTAKAVGTQFSVRISDNETVVMVSEGIVEVRQPEAVADISVLKAGDVARLKPALEKAEVEVVSFDPGKISNRHSWKDGVLIFEGEPLSTVVKEISRYTQTDVVISDPELRDLPIGGVFPIGETSSLLGALETSFGVKANFIDSKTIYLTKAN